MEINLSDTVKQIIMAFILMVIPMLLILVGVLIELLNAWYFIGMVTWFGVGLIIFSVLNN
jgi:hypothetical protein